MASPAVAPLTDDEFFALLNAPATGQPGVMDQLAQASTAPDGQAILSQVLNENKGLAKTFTPDNTQVVFADPDRTATARQRMGNPQLEYWPSTEGGEDGWKHPAPGKNALEIYSDELRKDPEALKQAIYGDLLHGMASDPYYKKQREEFMRNFTPEERERQAKKRAWWDDVNSEKSKQDGPTYDAYIRGYLGADAESAREGQKKSGNTMYSPKQLAILGDLQKYIRDGDRVYSEKQAPQGGPLTDDQMHALLTQSNAQLHDFSQVGGAPDAEYIKPLSDAEAARDRTVDFSRPWTAYGADWRKPATPQLPPATPVNNPGPDRYVETQTIPATRIPGVSDVLDYLDAPVKQGTPLITEKIPEGALKAAWGAGKSMAALPAQLGDTAQRILAGGVGPEELAEPYVDMAKGIAHSVDMPVRALTGDKAAWREFARDPGGALMNLFLTAEGAKGGVRGVAEHGPRFESAEMLDAVNVKRAEAGLPPAGDLGEAGVYAGHTATGWNEAKDKFSALHDMQPRFEIDDSKAKVTKPYTSDLGEVSLHTILDHPEAYKQYPWTKDISVESLKPNSTEKAHWDSAANTIRVDPNATAGQQRTSILHELQHAIQDKEGFAPGTTANISAWASPKMRPLLIAEAKRMLNEWEPASYESFWRGEVTPEGQLAYAKYLDQWNSKEGKEQRWQAVQQGAVRSLYDRSPGEAEARDVERRANLTSEERAKIPPYSSYGKEGINRPASTVERTPDVLPPTRGKLPSKTDLSTIKGKVAVLQGLKPGDSNLSALRGEARESVEQLWSRGQRVPDDILKPLGWKDGKWVTEKPATEASWKPIPRIEGAKPPSDMQQLRDAFGQRGFDSRSQIDKAYSDLKLRQSLRQEMGWDKEKFQKVYDELYRKYDFIKDDTALGESHTSYSIRTDPPPKKTVKAYKLFRVNSKQPGKLFPLYVDASNEVPIGTWMDADIGEATPSGKVKAKGSPLAFRPGWHSGETPMATHIGERVPGDPKSKPIARRPDEVWAEVEVPADVDWQEEANKRARRNKKGEIVPVTAHITDQIPKDGYYRYKTNSNMTGNWIISGAVKVNKVLSDAEVKAINDKSGVADLPRKEPVDLNKLGFGKKDSENANQFAQSESMSLPEADTSSRSQGKPEIGEQIKFIRYGKPTQNSTDWSKGEQLKGMSVYSLDEKGAAHQTVRSEFADRKDVYVGIGKVVGYGTDGEPLVSDYTVRKARKSEDEKAYYGGVTRARWLKEHGYDKDGNKIVNQPKEKRTPHEFAQPESMSLPEASKKITETPEFKNWFRKSPFVGPDGNPLIAYHATNNDFGEFGRTGDRIPSLGLGYYFSPDAGKSAQYGNKIMPVYLTADKLLDWDNLSKTDRHVIAAELAKYVPPDQMAGYGSIKEKIFGKDERQAAKQFFEQKKEETKDYFHDRAKPKVEARDSGFAVTWMEPGLESASPQDLLNLVQRYDNGIAQRLGYDGARSGSEIVVFKPTQIKSIFNRGKFDPKKADILSKADRKPSWKNIQEEFA